VDSKDQSLPLTMYRTSYLASDFDLLPDGKAWTINDIATRPALHSAFTFNSSFTSASVPYLADGTPFAVMARLHTTYRGSQRMQFRFYCSSFVSARFLITIAPIGVTATHLSNNLSRMIDVKGDTVINVTFPMIYFTDMLRGCNSLFQPYTIFISLYNDIISADVTTDPNIDLVVFSAAGPDAQFSYPMPGTWDYSYPTSTRVRSHLKVTQQTDIVTEFDTPFAPFVEGASYLTDQKCVTSETSLLVTDLLKRYATAAIDPPTTRNWQLPAVFTPNNTSLQHIFYSMFAFSRGGIRYKLVYPPQTGRYQTAFKGIGSGTIAGATSDFSMMGNAGMLWDESQAESDVSVPYVSIYPYDSVANIVSDAGSHLYPPFIQTMVMSTSTNLSTTGVLLYTAVRDDYQLGFLLPPSPTTGLQLEGFVNLGIKSRK